jgi:beta-phosphoglucomutase
MSNKKAFLFDLNGTMIDDMQYHINAWYRILNELGAGISMERMKEECYGKNDELLERMFPGRFTSEEIARMSFEKEKQYQAEFKPHLTLLPGLHGFLQKAKEQEIAVAIGSAAILFNIDFVLDGLAIRHYFDVIVGAEDVKESKPSPETYLTCAARLGIETSSCIVFEDSTKGVESALLAGMDCVAITTLHEKHAFEPYNNVLMCVADYTDVCTEILLQ